MSILFLCATVLLPVIGTGVVAGIYGLLFCRREALHMLAAILYAILFCGLLLWKTACHLFRLKSIAGHAPVKHVSTR